MSEPKILNYMMDDGTHIQCLLSMTETRSEKYGEQGGTYAAVVMYVDGDEWLNCATHWAVLDSDPELGEWFFVPITACVFKHGQLEQLRSTLSAMGALVGMDERAGMSLPQHITDFTPEHSKHWFSEGTGGKAHRVAQFLLDKGYAHADTLGLTDLAR